MISVSFQTQGRIRTLVGLKTVLILFTHNRPDTYHTLLLRRVGLDVDDVTNTVGREEGRHVDSAMLCDANRPTNSRIPFR